MFDVIELSELSITWQTLLYLNLPPNLLMFEVEYVLSTDVTFDFKSLTLVTLELS